MSNKKYSDEPLTAKEIPARAPGCSLRFWHDSGAIGINDRLVAYEGTGAVIRPSEISKRSANALAKHMIELWTKFKDAAGPPERDA